MLHWVHSCFVCTALIPSVEISQIVYFSINDIYATHVRSFTCTSNSQKEELRVEAYFSPPHSWPVAAWSGRDCFLFFPSEIDTETLWKRTYNSAALEGAGGYERKDFQNYPIVSPCEASHLPWICATAGRSAVVPHRGSRGWGGRGMGFSLYALNIPLIPYAVTLWW